MFDTYHIHLNDDKKLNKILNLLHMANESLQELLDRISALEQGGVATARSLTNIADDITRIKDGLPTTGGIDAVGVEQLRVSLTNAQAAISTAQNQAAALDLENEPTPEPEPEA